MGRKQARRQTEIDRLPALGRLEAVDIEASICEVVRDLWCRQKSHVAARGAQNATALVLSHCRDGFCRTDYHVAHKFVCGLRRLHVRPESIKGIRRSLRFFVIIRYDIERGGKVTITFDKKLPHTPVDAGITTFEKSRTT